MSVDRNYINTSIDRSQHTVLVVEDDPAMRYANARTIRVGGFQTLEVGTGAEALDAVRNWQVSAVVLDVNLPDIDGFTICRTLRADPRTMLLPVIHLSAAYVQNEDKVEGLNAGADAYLVHPAEPAVLLATLQALIRARNAEENVRRADTRFAAVYSQALSGIALVRSDGVMADVNPALAALLGLSADRLVGRAVAEFAPAGWAEFVQDKTVGAFEEGNPWFGEFPLMRSDGRLVHLEWSISSHVEPGLRVAIAVDVSERIELDRRRQEVLEREQAARAVAERHSRTKDDFVAVLSHELRTPLNSIAGWVHILHRRGGSPELMKGLEAIDRNVKAQARIIADILDVSRINSGKLRLDPESVDPAEVVSASVDALRDAIDEKSLQVALDWRVGAHAPAWLDVTRFQQIVWNLLTNAIKFSDDRGRVELSLQREGDTLVLEVRDHGRGIEPAFLEHLFDRFSQSDSPDNRLHGGLGLGLSIVRHLAELHGGVASAHSEGLGQGSVMRVTLQVAVPAAGVAEGDAANERRGGIEQDASGERALDGLDVLIVEDNADASEMLTVVLADGGARVALAPHFDGALVQLASRWPDVLVSDIGLPGRDGYELIRQVRALEKGRGGRRLLSIAFTAFARPEDKARAIEAGFDAHLAKPLQPHLLMALIAELRRGAG
ncbi:response regulator [Xylophilus sp. GOD-11R]|uniref:hybrid sensor histidine kinase/response regulator n=1 Tax=Xylophilus sp. GOD-11R TaxID=3089814 RepID=UPI00298CE466|nr:response regulator [Xylophilus sp. GOD-11R]WPB56061.1 response regulator [Xylophilus sp. GOD-11R]